MTPEIEQAIANAVAFRLNPTKWITQDGRQLDVSDMDDRHVANTFLIIDQGRMKRQSCNGISTARWRTIFRNELAARLWGRQRPMLAIKDFAASLFERKNPVDPDSTV